MALIHVAYSSAAAVAFSDRNVRNLLERARKTNAGLGVTGILLLIESSFFQILEGPSEVVAALYEKIGADTRHIRVVKLIEEPMEQRDFSDWSMGLARVTSKELVGVPGFRDAFATRQSVEQLDEGSARFLLSAFREGRFRSRIGS